MKKYTIKIIGVLMILFCIIMSNNIAMAFSLNVSSDAKTINNGDTVKIKIASDEKFVTADFKLKYDNNAFEYVESDYPNVTIKDYASQGYLMIVYADLSGQGTNEISVKFKAKQKSNSAKFSILDSNFTNDAGTSYAENQVEANSATITIKDKTDNDSQSQNTNNIKNDTVTDTNNIKNDTVSDTNVSTTNNTATSLTPNTNKDTATSLTVNTDKNTTTTSQTNLPHTGLGTNILIIAIIIISIILAIIFRKKEKYWKGIGMFIVTFSIITAYSSNIYSYSKIPTYGMYENLVENQKVLAICLDKNETEKKLIANQISNLVSNVSTFIDINNNAIDKNSTIGTGSKAVLSDNSEISILLYGDVNGDGKINSSDIYPIIQHILNNKKLEGIYAKAANLNNKNDADDKNINSSDIYPLIKYILNDLSTELVTTFANNENQDNENNENNVRINYSKSGWTNETVTANITSDKEMKAVSNWSLSNDKKTISRKYSENTTETITLNYIDGTSESVVVKVSNIDTTKPTITSELAVNKEKATTGETVEMTLSYNATDDNSGIDKVIYEAYSGEEKIKEEEITQSKVLTFNAAEGVNYKINIYTLDRAGNKSDIKTFTIEQIKYSDTEQGRQEKAVIDQEYNSNKTKLNQQKQDLEAQSELNTQEYNQKMNTINQNHEYVMEKLEEAKIGEQENIINHANLEIAEIQQQTDSELQDLLEQYEGRLKIYTNEKELEIINIKMRYAQEVADAKASGAEEEAINKIIENFEGQLILAESKYQEKVQALEADYHGQRQKLIDHNTEAIASINAATQNRLNTLNAQIEEEKQAEINNYNSLVNDAQDEYNYKQRPINLELDEVNYALENIETQYNERIATLTNTIYIKKD